MGTVRPALRLSPALRVWLIREWQGLALVMVAMLGNGVALLPELTYRGLQVNDSVLHQLNLFRTIQALLGGENALEFWLAQITAGFPLFQFYQPLPYLLVGQLAVLFGASTVTAYGITTWLLLSLAPVAFYIGCRRLDLDPLQSGIGAAAAVVFSTPGLYGFDYLSYTWRGYGLWTQLVAMVIAPLALAEAFRWLQGRGSIILAAALLAGVLLSHLALGYTVVVAVTIAAIVIAVSSRSWLVAPMRLAALGFATLLPMLWFLIPYAQGSPWLNRSIWEAQWKYDSFGAGYVLEQLITGGLFDSGRWPVLTLLLAAGVVACVLGWRSARNRVLVIVWVALLVLFFGRATLGVLADLLPLARDLHLHRVMAGVHLVSVPLIGLGGGLVLRWLLARPRWGLPAAIAVALLVVVPILSERTLFYRANGEFIGDNARAIAAEARDLDSLLRDLRSRPQGRVYAGLAATWGAGYRVGSTPMYGLLQQNGFDMVGFLYHALALTSDIQVLFNENLATHYRLFNVRYVVAPVGQPVPDFLRLIGEYGRHRLYEAPGTGYTLLGQSPERFSGNRSEWYLAASIWLNGPQVAAWLHPVLAVTPVPDGRPMAEAPLAVAQLPFVPALPGAVSNETGGPGRFSATVQLNQEALVVLSSTYHPGWQVTANGVRVPTFQVAPSFLGFGLPAGTYQIVAEYQSSPLKGPLFFLGIVGMIALAVAERRRPASVRKLWDRGLAWGRTYEQRLTSAVASRPSLLLDGRDAGAVTGLWLLAMLPLLPFRLWSGHDALNYLPRDQQFWRILTEGILLPRWAPDLSTGYGEPFFNFNPPAIYWFTAVFRFLGATFIPAQVLGALALSLIAAIGMYLAGRQIGGRVGGLIATAFYLFAPFFMVQLYVRHAMADFAAYAAFPWIILGLIVLARSTRIRPGGIALVAVGTAGVMLASNPLALVTVPTFVLLAAWLAVRARSIAVGASAAGGFALGLALSAWFWLPALAEREFIQTARLLTSFLAYPNHFVGVLQLFWSPPGHGLSVPGTDDGFTLMLGPVHLLVLAVVVVAMWRFRAVPLVWTRSLLVGAAVAVGMLAFLTTFQARFIWDAVPLLQYLQFPWRIHALITVLLALIAAALPLTLPALPWPRPRFASMAIWPLLVVTLSLGVWIGQPDGYLTVSEDQFTPAALRANAIATTTAREYEPIWVSRSPTEPAPVRAQLVGGGDVATSIYRIDYQRYPVNAPQPSLLLVNTHYFPGWRAYLDGTEVAITVPQPEGTMAIVVPPGLHVVEIRWESTPVRTAGELISLAGALGLLGLAAWAFLLGRR